ncbi:MAG: TIM barrel protein [Gemmatimonadetes bacterium]|nr:TIM barrel protein [Gemmatimonadota bacterium]
MNRRDLLGTLAVGVVGLSGGRVSAAAETTRRPDHPSTRPPDHPSTPPRLKQSVSRWPYESIPLPEFARRCKGIVLAAIDLLQPEEWKVVQDAGLVASMGYPSKRDDFLTTGFNDVANHPMLLKELEAALPRAAVTLCVELLNSRIDHHDYQGDHAAWGVEVMQGVGSPRVKLLYDIYHMQIMDGDIIRTIRDNIQYFGHFHTGGVPGRHELDDTQELNWRAVARAIADLGFQGFVAHEFVPTRDPMTSLKEAFETCNV